MNILSLASIFPNPSEPELGLFVAARLRALHAIETVKVVAPIAPFDYDNPNRQGLGKRSVPRERMEGPLEVFHPAWGYPPGNSAVKGRLMALQLYPIFRRIRRKFPFEWIDGHFAHPEGVAAAYLAQAFGCQYSITMRGNELEYALDPAKRRRMQQALQGAAAILCVSRPLAELAEELSVAPSRVHRIGNGINSAIYRIWDEPPARDGRPLRMLAAGRLIHRKRFPDILRALAGLNAGGIPANLQIIGGPGRGLANCFPELEALTRTLGITDRVEFLGSIPPERLARRMSEADLFCMASEREGWPNVVQEALACGCPVVATDVGEARHIIGDESSGLVVPVNNPRALEEALRQASQTRWDRRAISARASKRDWNHVAVEVAQVFREAATTPSPPHLPVARPAARL